MIVRPTVDPHDVPDLPATPDNGADLRRARTVFERVGTLSVITIRPHGGADEWTTATFQLGPYHAYVRLDPEAAIASAVVEVGVLDVWEAVEDALYDIPHPRPKVVLPLDGRTPLTIEHSHPLGLVDEDVAIGLLGASAFYTVALTEELWDAFVPATRRHLELAGFRPGRGFGHDPIELLGGPEPAGPEGDSDRIGPFEDDELVDNVQWLDELTARVGEFVEERGWQENHTPKNLTMALAGEVGGLLHAFQWASDKDIARQAMFSELSAEVTDHLADAFLYLIRLADACNLDLLSLGFARLEENRERFPLDET